MYKNAPRKRKHLSLVLQASEWRREHKSVIVALEVAARSALRVVVVFKSEALVVDQSVPVHHMSVACEMSDSKGNILSETGKKWISGG